MQGGRSGWVNWSIGRVPVLVLTTLLYLGFACQASATAPEAGGQVIPNHYIVVLKDSVDHPGTVAEAQTERLGGKINGVYRHALEGYAATLSANAVDALRHDPHVAYVTPDYKIELFEEEEVIELETEDNGDGEVSAATIPTGISRTGAPGNKQLSIDGVDNLRTNVDVAVIDTGIDREHPDLDVAGSTYCASGKCIDENRTDFVGHGTHVAGTIGAIDNSQGVVGMAPGARLWSVQVFPDNVLALYGTSASAVIAGIDWVTAHAGEIEVANMSLGCKPRLKEGVYQVCGSQAEDEAIAASVEAGVVYVVAAGNSALDAKYVRPASDPDVITVSAVADYDGKAGGLASPTCNNFGADDTRATFSDFGSTVDIAAPGVCILSTKPSNQYAIKSGTSMASPHVAGAAAVLASKSNPNSKKDVEAIRETLIKAGNSGWTDTSGDGITEPLLDVSNESTFKAQPTLPAVTTGAASPIKQVEATLHGTVDPERLPTKYFFEYGRTTAYGSKTAEFSAGSGTSPVEVSQTVSGLIGGAEYHYRLVATNPNVVAGADKTFKTVLSWYSCEKVGSSGVYTDSACQSEGKGSYDWSKISSTPATTPLTGSAPFTLSGTISLTKTKITCASASGTGKVANPSAEAAGTFSTEAASSLVLSGCTVVEGYEGGGGCQIEGGSIKFNALSGVATEFEGGHAVKIGEEGKTLATFKITKIEGKKCPTTTVTVTGAITATLNPAASSLEITEAGGKSIKTNGSGASITGTVKIETAAGEGLRLGTPPPANTGLPAVSPTSPAVGTTLSTSNGGWAHEPTSYAYQWKRCSLSGSECKEIPGATKASYTAGGYDEGHTLVAQVTATNAGGSKSATSAPSKAVDAEAGGTHHWYVCQKVGSGGSYEDAACGSYLGPEGPYEWVELKEGSSTSFTSTNTTPIKLSYEVQLTKSTIECTSESGSGTVLNPTGGGAGTLSGANTLLKLTGCKYINPPSGCSVNEGTIWSASVTGTSSGHSIAIGNGSSLLSFSTAGCGTGYSVTGTLNGTVNSAYSSLEFDSTSGSGLKCFGATWYFEGSIQLKTSGGGLLRFKP